MDDIDRVTNAGRFALVHHNPRICADTGRARANFAIMSCHDDSKTAEAALSSLDHDAITGFYHVHEPVQA